MMKSFITDPVSDLVARLRNALLRSKAEVRLPLSKLRLNIVALLKAEGYLKDYAVVEGKDSSLLLELRYHDGESAINGMELVSRPGRRIYLGSRRLPRVLAGHGVAVVSTSQGLLSDSEARRRRLGGEVLFKIW